QLLNEMAAASAHDDGTLVVTLSGNQNRQTILTIIDLPVLSRAYYADREFDASTLDAPLSSGPYKVGALSAGRFINYERVADYWAAELPVARGHSNFDAIRIDFYTERQAGFEAFKKGDITYRQEFTSLNWAQGYDFPAAAQGKVKKSSAFKSEARPSMQGWYFNTRRGKFADPRTRQAIALAFDFEWTNRILFFDSYARQVSYFQKSQLAAAGPPQGAELALLEPHRGNLPAAVFAAPYVPPKTDGSGRDRGVLKQAQDLLSAAGWRPRDGSVVDSDGNPLTIEFLIRAAVFERVLSPFVENLRRIGVTATIRQVDPAQYAARLDDFDFDIVGAAFSLSATPLEGLQLFFGSESAARAGGNNLAGISDPVIDALLEEASAIETRGDLVAMSRAIDRVLRAQHYWIANWFLANHRVAHWDIFGWPQTKPDYAFEPERTWWFDAERASAIGYTG
ncbi:MAG: extracellular solute-binding protein, partial [Alphaproteobacteria bacterium]